MSEIEENILIILKIFQTNSWTLTSQTLNGHPEIGFYGASMIESAPHLIMIGGTDGLNYYDNVYAYNEEFGFYDTGVKLSSPKAEMAALALQQKDDVSTTTTTTTTTTTVTTPQQP